MVHCAVFILNVKTLSANWQFNTALFSDLSFREVFKLVWLSHREKKSSFTSGSRWWDFGKTLIQQFGQQYNGNVTKYITRSLQDLEIEVQNLLNCTGDQGQVKALKSKKAKKRKIIHCLRSEDGSLLTQTTDIQKYATCFYTNLFKSEWAQDSRLESAFLSGLPQIEESAVAPLAANLTLEEL